MGGWASPGPRLRSAPVMEAATGAAAGLIAGVLVAAAMLARGVEAPGLLPSTATALWVPIHLLVTTALGCAFGFVYRYRAGAYAATISSGIVGGLVWWIVGPLTVVPLVAGDSPTWSIADATTLFPSLIGSLFFGALAGILFYGLSSLRTRIGPVTATAPEPRTRSITRVVILGGGFGGVAVARGLEQSFVRNPDIEITLVSQGNYLLFTPMLAEVASSSLEAQHISSPVRASCPRTRFVRGVVESVEPATARVTVRCPGAPDQVLTYDHLVIALGSVPHFYGLPGLEKYAFTLKSLADATRIRNHVIATLERAELELDPAERRRLVTFVVAGGGFAGTETIAELFDLVRSVLRYYPAIAPDEPRFVLVHSRDRILPELGEKLAGYALRKLRARGIEFELGVRIAGATAHAVQISGRPDLPAATLVWTAGNRPNPILEQLPYERNRAGALIVDSTLRLAGQTNVWGVGDCVEIPVPGVQGATYPPTAQHALREGQAVAANIALMLKGRLAKPFKFNALGVLVALGHRTAVAEIRGVRFSGLIAWLMWRAVYFVKLPGAERKARVLFDWTLDLFFPRDTVLTADAPPPDSPVTAPERGSL